MLVLTAVLAAVLAAELVAVFVVMLDVVPEAALSSRARRGLLRGRPHPTRSCSVSRPARLGLQALQFTPAAAMDVLPAMVPLRPLDGLAAGTAFGLCAGGENEAHRSHECWGREKGVPQQV